MKRFRCALSPICQYRGSSLTKVLKSFLHIALLHLMLYILYMINASKFRSLALCFRSQYVSLVKSCRVFLLCCYASIKSALIIMCKSYRLKFKPVFCVKLNPVSRLSSCCPIYVNCLFIRFRVKMRMFIIRMISRDVCP